MRRSLVLTFVMLVLTFPVALTAVQIAFVHEYSPAFRWYSSTVTVKDLSDNYSTEIDTAVFEYGNYTDMDWSESSSSNMIFVEMDLGATGWVARELQSVPPMMVISGA